MKQRVTVFVWNYFTYDARVMRECSALAENGNDVTLIALHNTSDKNCAVNETVNGFDVVRVKKGFPVINKGYRLFARLIKKPIAAALFVLLFAVFVAAMFVHCLPVAIVALCLAALFVVSVFLKAPKHLANLGGILRMIKVGRKTNADIYHANDLNTMFQAYACAKLFRLRKNRKKIVYDSHEVQTSRTGYGKGIYTIEKFFIKKADKIFCENNTRAKYMADLYKMELPTPVYNYPEYFDLNDIEAVDLKAQLDIPADCPILLYQGGIQYGRGLDVLVQAIPHIKRGVVVFIGDGRFKPELLKLIKQYGVEDRVRLIGMVPLRQLASYTVNAYLGFQILNNVCFNHYSAASNKLFEYIMAGVPVVAADFPEFHNVVKKYDVGVLVDSHDYKSIAAAVNFLLDDEEYRDNLSRNCYAAAKELNWNNHKDEFIGEYAKIEAVV
ncbi:MAG: glycosyltransferase [Clostridia bacterium]|nr:glycosyltransferase [Clostridia bacterium]